MRSFLEACRQDLSVPVDVEVRHFDTPRAWTAPPRSTQQRLKEGVPAPRTSPQVHCSPAGRQQLVLLERWRLQFDASGAGARLAVTGAGGSASSHMRLAASNSSSSGGSAGATRLAGDDGALYKRLVRPPPHLVQRLSEQLNTALTACTAPGDACADAAGAVPVLPAARAAGAPPGARHQGERTAGGGQRPAT